MAGYQNAFYDIGQYLLSKNKLDDAFKAYKKVPSNSSHYSEVNVAISENYFARALESNISKNTRSQHLREALIHALLTKMQTEMN